MPKKIVAAENLVFDFDLFIDARYECIVVSVKQLYIVDDVRAPGYIVSIV